MGRVERINEVIKNHDPKLFCRSMDGKLCIFRENWKWEPYEVDDDVYYFIRPNHFLIIAMTTDWRISSAPADWGLLPIMRRLDEIDLWKRDLSSEVIKQEEDYSDMKSRERMSNNEAFLKEFRPQFAKATNDVVVSGLKKKDTRSIKKIKEY